MTLRKPSRADARGRSATMMWKPA